MYGTQTILCATRTTERFENDVKMYGTQTNVLDNNAAFKFENDVKMYGTQTTLGLHLRSTCLRMM